MKIRFARGWLLAGAATIAVSLVLRNAAWDSRPVVRVGSKVFTESYVLAEIAAQAIEQAGEARVERKFGLGGTGILEQAIATGAIDLYPEYTGTIAETLLHQPELRDRRKIEAGLPRLPGTRLAISRSLGFNNTYSLALRRDFARAHHLVAIGDLRGMPSIRAGFSHEFLDRPDGYPGLSRRYGLRLERISAMSHSLAYGALAGGGIDMTDVYSTDAKIAQLGLVLLKDDLDFFPRYEGVWLARAEWAKRFPKSWAALRALEGRISDQQMIALNSRVDIDGQSFRQAASSFLRPGRAGSGIPAWWERIAERTVQHLELVFVSLAFSIALGIPLGVLALRFKIVRQPILLLSGMVQTIPSLALLCFLIPVFGIGTVPALVALFLYALLPIVSNVYTGLSSIDIRLLESARALGLSPMQRLRQVELPLASPSILGGIRTAAVISVGTATLAALIGAGGYGAPIVTGLAINDLRMILEGAIPAAVLSVLVQALFVWLERRWIPESLRAQG